MPVQFTDKSKTVGQKVILFLSLFISCPSSFSSCSTCSVRRGDEKPTQCALFRCRNQQHWTCMAPHTLSLRCLLKPGQHQLFSISVCSSCEMRWLLGQAEFVTRCLLLKEKKKKVSESTRLLHFLHKDPKKNPSVIKGSFSPVRLLTNFWHHILTLVRYHIDLTLRGGKRGAQSSFVGKNINKTCKVNDYMLIRKCCRFVQQIMW